MRNKISFPEIIPASDRAILVKFGNQISKNLHKQVFSLIKYLLDNKIDDTIEKLIALKTPQTIVLSSTGINKQNVTVSKFTFEWSLKIREK